MHGAFTKQSLCSVGSYSMQPQFYAPSAGLLVGDHLQQSGPSMAAILGPGDHLWQHNLPQMARGDQLWRGTNCGGTGPIVLTKSWAKSLLQRMGFVKIRASSYSTGKVSAEKGF